MSPTSYRTAPPRTKGGNNTLLWWCCPVKT